LDKLAALPALAAEGQPRSLQSYLREQQDRARNAGWRIQWIPWQKAGQPKRAHGTPLSVLTEVLGVGLILGGIAYGYELFRTTFATSKVAPGMLVV
jgi:hypothetical protein